MRSLWLIAALAASLMAQPTGLSDAGIFGGVDVAPGSTLTVEVPVDGDGFSLAVSSANRFIGVTLLGPAGTYSPVGSESTEATEVFYNLQSGGPTGKYQIRLTNGSGELARVSYQFRLRSETQASLLPLRKVVPLGSQIAATALISRASSATFSAVCITPFQRFDASIQNGNAQSAELICPATVLGEVTVVTTVDGTTDQGVQFRRTAVTSVNVSDDVPKVEFIGIGESRRNDGKIQGMIARVLVTRKRNAIASLLLTFSIEGQDEPLLYKGDFVFRPGSLYADVPMYIDDLWQYLDKFGDFQKGAALKLVGIELQDSDADYPSADVPLTTQLRYFRRDEFVAP